jgi:hypothetical protein
LDIIRVIPPALLASASTPIVSMMMAISTSTMVKPLRGDFTV